MNDFEYFALEATRHEMQARYDRMDRRIDTAKAVLSKLIVWRRG